MKNTLLALLAFILLLTPVAATAQFIYITNNGAITITRYTGPGGAVSIPDSITDLPVTAIGDSAFQFSTITTVAIPGSVTNIGIQAFYSCPSLTSVAVPNSVTGIGFNAFRSCASLTNVTIPASDIGSYAFYDCTNLASVIFIMSNGVFGIGDYAFAGCVRLTSVIMSNGVIVIGDFAFNDCTSLTSVTIPGSVTFIGSYAFDYCTSLTNVTIPSSVTWIGDFPFYECTSLTAITVDAGNSVYSSADGVLFNKSQTTLLECPGGKAGSYTVPGSVTSIGHGAFFYCTSLTSVTIPGSLTNIGNSAFVNCTFLTSVKIPNSVTNIPDSAFENCTSLTSVIIPSSVTSIGNYAFEGCTSLANITIPGGVTSIGDDAFAEYLGLKGVFFDGNAPGFVGGDVFLYSDDATVYYLPGTSGWSATFAGRPAVLWNPLIQSSGVGPAGFGFNITGTTNIPIVIDATTNLANSYWVPLQSLNLTNGTFHFSDPTWTIYPARVYRIRSP